MFKLKNLKEKVVERSNNSLFLQKICNQHMITKKKEFAILSSDVISVSTLFHRKNYKNRRDARQLLNFVISLLSFLLFLVRKHLFANAY